MVAGTELAVATQMVGEMPRMFFFDKKNISVHCLNLGLCLRPREVAYNNKASCYEMKSIKGNVTISS